MEVARLEAELRTPDRASSSEIIIMERDRKIRQVMSMLKDEVHWNHFHFVTDLIKWTLQMEKEMEELKKQRDNAQLKLEELQKKMGDNQPVSICPFLANLLFFQRISASQNHIHLLST